MTTESKLKAHTGDDEMFVKMTLIMKMLSVNDSETDVMINEIITEYVNNSEDTKVKINDLIKVHIDDVFSHLIDKPLHGMRHEVANTEWIKRVFAFVKFIINTIDD